MNSVKQPAGLSLKSEDAFADDELHAHRAGVYELLGRLLAGAPDAALLGELQAIGEVDTGDGPMAMGWEMLRHASVEADAERVEDEYFRLFLGVGRGELVPFGSWYLTGFLMEKPLAALRTDLSRLGIERQDGVVESEDHVAALCDAMAILIREQVPWRAQQQFFGDHLAPWVVRFFTDVESAGNARFYRSVGFFGTSFFEFEQRLMSMHA